jgi:hypothetical protein
MHIPEHMIADRKPLLETQVSAGIDGLYSNRLSDGIAVYNFPEVIFL